MASRSSNEAADWKKCSIYRVPAHIATLHKNAYMPLVVSFGPYHHDDEQLKPMEEHKKRALFHLLERTNKPFDAFVRAVKEVVPDLMDCYDNLDKKWRCGDDFLKMMIYDGCVLLEILYTAKEIPRDYSSGDPIFSDYGMFCNMSHIARDILMLENQLPLLVLKKLESVANRTTDIDKFLIELIFKFCNADTTELTPTDHPHLHVLDVYRRSMLQGICPTFYRSSRPQGDCPNSPRQNQESNRYIMRSARELRDGGIHFRKSNTSRLTHINFNEQSGQLTLPYIVIDDATEHNFLNLLAFERLHESAGTEVSSYIFFMDNIIDTAEDVHLLRQKGIINNALGSDEAVAKLFNDITKDMPVDLNYPLRKLHQVLNLHCKRKWNKWMATFRHHHIQNPWAIISIIAGMFLVFLTTVQTIYQVLPYHRPT